MLRQQIQSLQEQIDESTESIAVYETRVKEDKKKLSLLKSAHKRLVDLEEQLNEQPIVSA